MRKTLIFLILLLSLLLGACAYRTPMAPMETFPAETLTEVASPVVQKATQPATPSPAAQATSALVQAASGCTVQSPYPTPGPTEQALLPPAGENDWVSGPDTASTTLIEYSDFQ